MMRLKLAVLTMAILCASASVLASPVVFSNPYDVNSTNAYSSANGLHQSVADYDYDGSFSITDFHWWGIPYGTVPGFRFEIWSDDGTGLPGTNVYFENIIGDAGATAVGDQVSGLDVYKYGFDLATPFSGPGGKYWFSVVGLGQENWFWALSGSRQFNDDLQYVGTIGGTIVLGNPYENDFAFEISSGSSVVPEPATMTLFGLGLLGSALAARRSKKKNHTDA
jgi:hypothetical protein